MANWIVEGAKRENGADAKITVTAETQKEAVVMAGAQGILVSKVTQVPSLDYATRGKKNSSERDVPEYKDIIRGRKVLRFCAVCAFGLGAFRLVWPLLSNSKSIDTTGAISEIIEGVIYAIPCFIVAVLLLLIGAVSTAIRDIAQNSFNRV